MHRLLLAAIALITTASVLVPATAASAAESVHDRRYAITQLTDGGTPVGLAQPDGAGEQIVFSWQPPGADAPAVWLHDIASGEQRILAAGNGRSAEPMISEDGKWVSFVSSSTDLTDDVDTDDFDVFLIELSTGDIERITPGVGVSRTPTIDSDGDAIAFESTITNLDPTVTATGPSVYRWTRSGGFDLVANGEVGSRPMPVIDGRGQSVVIDDGFRARVWSQGLEPVEARSGFINREQPDINNSGTTTVYQSARELGPKSIKVDSRCCIATYGPTFNGQPENATGYQPTLVGDNTMVYVFRDSAPGEPYELRHTGSQALGTIFQSNELTNRPSFGYSADVLTFQSAATSIDASPSDVDVDFYYWDRRATPSCGGGGLPWGASARPMQDQIVRLYQATFGRSPDQGGLEFWVDQRAAGMSLNAVAEAFQTSPEWTTRYGTDVAPGLTITLLYENVLDRPPDSGGFDFWLGELSRGRTLTDVVLSFTDSPENIGRTNTAAVQTAEQGVICRVYQAVFDRVPDRGGFDFWMSQSSSGVATSEIVRQMTASPEWNLRYGSTSGRQLVQAIYINVLGRAPDSAGESFWTQQVFDGLPVEDLVLAFTESPENIVRTGTTP